MKPFTVSNSATISEAAATLAKGSAAILAGGTDLLPGLKAMNSPATPPATLVNLKTIPNLAYIKEENGMLKIGALTTLTTIAKNSTVLNGYKALAQGCQSCSHSRTAQHGDHRRQYLPEGTMLVLSCRQ